ncbi:hypothetical protein C1H46_016535 [Malus baccata]|uniref:Uncharacterized protein n=1 Tax=Malus baccata TaxID=106549 RepID=A0A540MGF5_MALBA|nr:hypothetical protein C1H46_016535 [Malus baccata]
MHHVFPIKLFDTSLPSLTGVVTCWFPDTDDRRSCEEVYNQICFGPQGHSPTGQDLIINANSFDMGVRVVSDDVSLDPVDSERLRLGDGGEVLVGRSTVTLMSGSDLFHHSISSKISMHHSIFSTTPSEPSASPVSLDPSPPTTTSALISPTP